MDDLLYNYHDAALESIQFHQHTLELHISLYPIVYTSQLEMKLVIETITNLITCEKWVNLLSTTYQEENENRLGARINTIFLDSTKKNQLIIAIDSIKNVKLNFTNIKEILIDN